ncbi:TonB-dependent receptor [bacterium]|nr:TonB-dependent receptor [bacterium]
MKSRLLFALLITLITVQTVKTQPGNNSNSISGAVTGHVFDATFDIPMEYANVILYNCRDSVAIAGDATDKNGLFIIPISHPGEFYIDVTFIGYESKTIGDIRIGRGAFDVDVGNVNLLNHSIALDDVEVSIERYSVEYKIDKKIINVGKQATTISGTAVDVLESSPSVAVDIEGNVSMRGSSNFTVMVDGRPSLLEANDVLQQIPASTIDNIEIITNPSARYDPEGIAGIINVILKKNILRGISGTVNANGGFDDRYGGDVLMNYCNDHFNVTFGIDYNQRSRLGNITERSRTYYPDTTLYLNSNGTMTHGGKRYGIRGILDYTISDKDAFSLGFRYGGGNHEHDNRQTFTQWEEPGAGESTYTSIGVSNHERFSLSFNANWSHDFEQKDHRIITQFDFGRRGGDEETRDELIDVNGLITDGKISTEGGPGDRWQFNIDYTKPIGEKYKFESGYQTRIRRMNEKTDLHQYNPATQLYEPQVEYFISSIHDEDRHSLYSLYSGEYKRLGFQGGLRGEYTYRIIKNDKANSEFSLDHWDYFPSAHLSYSISEQNQLMTSYSRRIDRPRGWYLEPFLTWRNAYSVRMGNPDLKPEYIDSYELGFRRNFNRNYFVADAFYRKTNNKIERIRSVYQQQQNVTLETYDNVGTDHSYGTEFTLNCGITKWWNIRTVYDIFQYNVEGASGDEDFSNSSFNWDLRLNSDVVLSKKLRVQINGNYESPTVTSQGRTEGRYSSRFAVKYEIIPRTFSATLQIRDPFGSSNRESTTDTDTIYMYRLYERDSQTVMLNLNYIFNNYKPEKSGRGEGGEDDEMEDEF